MRSTGLFRLTLAVAPQRSRRFCSRESSYSQASGQCDDYTDEEN